MVRRLTLLLLCTFAVPVFAHICPASNFVPVAGSGIGDGCTTEYYGVDFDFLLPNIGIYKSTFTPACDHHDKCWTTLGVDYDQCDSTFLTEMRNACDSQFNQWLMPAENGACRLTAQAYKSAVTTYRTSIAPGVPAGFQREALLRSGRIENDVKNDVCGTTPERTTLYAQAFIDRVNSAFIAAAGRKPTIYEFLNAVNQNNQNTLEYRLVDNPSLWAATLSSYAASAASNPPPPVGWYLTTNTYAISFNATPVLSSGYSYYWNIPNKSTSSSLSLSFAPPLYDRRVDFAGYVSVTNNVTGARNMALVETSVVLPGTCAPVQRPGVKCL